MWNKQPVSPDVDRVIKPIIIDMTNISIAEQMDPTIKNNEPENRKRLKRKCVHITYNQNQTDFVIRARKQEDGKFVCAVCGQEIGTEFNDDAIDDYFRCLKRVNQLCLFGLLHGMPANYLYGIIALKEMLPDVARIHKELNVVVSKENKDNNALDNLGAEYASSSWNNITGFYGNGSY
jgi:hypothetical protein